MTPTDVFSSGFFEKLAKVRRFYHGTFPSKVEQILREGLSPEHAGSGGGTLPGLDEMDPRKKVFLTTDPSYAQFYADMAAQGDYRHTVPEKDWPWYTRWLGVSPGERPESAVLEMDLPDTHPTHSLGAGLGSDEHYSTEVIPAKYLRKRAAWGRGFMEKLAELHWTSEPSALRHAKKHSGAMYLTPEQYLAAASKMYLARDGYQQIRDKRHKDAQVYWDSATGQKLVMTPAGKIVTFYNAGDAP